MENASFADDVRAYTAANRTEVERVTSEFQAAGGDAADLDDLVYDIAGSYGSRAANREKDEVAQEAVIADFESEAASINNDGIQLQVAAILMGNSQEEGERLVREACGSVLVAR